MSIDTAALDRAVNIVMPDVIFAMKNGSCRTYRFAIEAYYRSVCYEYHRHRPPKGNLTMSDRSEVDYAIESGRYLATAAENLMNEQNRAAMAGEDPDPDYWHRLASAVYEFRKRADRADTAIKLVRRLAAQQSRQRAQ